MYIYVTVPMPLLKEAVEKAKLVFIKSKKHIWNNRIGEDWSRAEHFSVGTQCWYLLKHPSSLIHVEAGRTHCLPEQYVCVISKNYVG